MTLPERRTFITGKAKPRRKPLPAPKVQTPTVLQRWRQSVSGVRSLFRPAGRFEFNCCRQRAHRAELGVPIPLSPGIYPRDPVDGSPQILPFHIKSRSFLFPVRSITLGCRVNLLFVMDADRKTILWRGDFLTPSGTVDFPGAVDYPCDGRLLTVRADGSLVIGHIDGSHLQTTPGAFRAPLTVLKLCVSVFGSYVDWKWDDQPFSPNMFQWPISPGAHQWARDPVIFDDDDAWIPPNSTVGAAYGWGIYSTEPDGSRHLIRGALMCDPISKPSHDPVPPEALDTPPITIGVPP